MVRLECRLLIAKQGKLAELNAVRIQPQQQSQRGSNPPSMVDRSSAGSDRSSASLAYQAPATLRPGPDDFTPSALARSQTADSGTEMAAPRQDQGARDKYPDTGSAYGTSPISRPQPLAGLLERRDSFDSTYGFRRESDRRLHGH